MWTKFNDVSQTNVQLLLKKRKTHLLNTILINCKPIPDMASRCPGGSMEA